MRYALCVRSMCGVKFDVVYVFAYVYGNCMPQSLYGRFLELASLRGLTLASHGW